MLTDGDDEKPEMTCGTEKDTPGNRAAVVAGSRTRQLHGTTSARGGAVAVELSMFEEEVAMREAPAR